MKKIIFIFFLTLIVPQLIWAEEDARQIIKLNITPDYIAHGEWNQPVDTAYDEYFGFYNYQNLAGLGIKYQLTSVSDELGELKVTDEGNDWRTVLVRQKGTANIQMVKISQDVTSPYKYPLAIYKFVVNNGAYFFKPRVEISYPADWQLLTLWPSPSETKPGFAALDYPTDTAYVSDVTVVFKTNREDSKIVLRQVGQFYILGTSYQASRIEDALKSSDFLSELLESRLGMELPNNVFILVRDLSDNSLGSEIEGLATRPNLVLLNEDLIQLKTKEELQMLLIHELSHVAMFNRRLFNQGSFFAPWFTEGLASFVEVQSIPYVFKDDAKLAEFELASGATERFNSAELSIRYKHEYDLFHDGNSYFPMPYSYRHDALVFGNFFDKYGAKALVGLFDSLSSQNIAVKCYECDSNLILGKMTGISRVSKDDLLFPSKGESNISQKLGDLLSPTYSDEVVIDVFKKYLANRVKKYFGASEAEATPLVEVVSKPPEEKRPVSSLSVATSAPKIAEPEKKAKQVTVSLASSPSSEVQTPVLTQEKNGETLDASTSTAPIPTTKISEHKSIWRRLLVWLLGR